MTPPLIDELNKVLQLKDRGPLLQALEALAQDNSFYDMADVWGVALLERNAAFFEPFLVRHLPRAPLSLLKTLWPRIEASGREQLFTELYPMLITQEQWNHEIAEILQAEFSDAEKEGMLLRRSTPNMRWYRLTEENALKLYQHDPVKFSPFIKQHVGRSWGQHMSYKALRQAAEQRGDGDLSWYLFREFASEKEWKKSLKRLLADPPAAEEITAELSKRHPRYGWSYDASIVARFLRRYGVDILPYLEEHLYWVSHRARDKFLQALRTIKDENIYWRLFFKLATNEIWQEQIRLAIQQSQSAAELYSLLQRRTPPSDVSIRWQRWWIDDSIAVALYKRDPQLFRPFIESYLNQQGYTRDRGTDLFTAAEANNDQELLNFLSFTYLRQASNLAWRQQTRWYRANEKDSERLKQLCDLLVARFDRLYAQSPKTYVRHVADTLSRYRAFEVWNFSVQIQHNHAFAYIFHRHREAWRNSAAGMRELLESTNIFIQILGLEILGEGGRAAAERVVENRLVLRALLLSRARKETKRLALKALEQAAEQDSIFATQILPLLEETMAFHGRKAIADDLMVSYVRCQTQLSMNYEG